jgi:hypothetical protein
MINLTAANISKWIAWGTVTITELHGMNNQGAILYIQLHEIPPLASGTLTNEAVPAYKSFQVLANAPFYFNLSSCTLKECFLVISTTELNYTAVAANGGLDMSVAAQSDFLCDGTETVVGDLVTTLNTLNVFTPGPNKLLRYDVIEQLGAARFVVIKPQGNGSNFVVAPIGANATLSANFGTDGFRPFAQNETTHVQDQSCAIAVCDVAPLGPIPTFTQTANSAVIRAIYK